VARLTGQQATVHDWEQRWGREGVWCAGCRRTTPVAMLGIEGRQAALACESCERVLLRGESWLAHVARSVPDQERVASRPPRWIPSTEPSAARAK